MTIPRISGWKRLAIALGIVLSGMALLPYIALPSAGFTWQLFAGVYGDEPGLAINYDTGAPGSTFTLTGFNYPANRTVTIKANGTVLGSTTTDEIGGFMIHITSNVSANEGFYEIEVEAEPASSNALSAVSASAMIRFRLTSGAPLRVPEGTATTLALPDGLTALELNFLPIVTR